MAFALNTAAMRLARRRLVEALNRDASRPSVFDGERAASDRQFANQLRGTDDERRRRLREIARMTAGMR